MSLAPLTRPQRRPGCEARTRNAVPHRTGIVWRTTPAPDHAGFDAAADRALAAQGGARRALLEDAAAVWTDGHIAGDRDDERTAGWPPATAHRYVAVLGALAGVCGEEGDFRGAIRWGRACLDLDHVNEPAHRELMLAYGRLGSVRAALDQYGTCRRTLALELGAPPSRQTEAVHAWLRRGALV